MVSALTNLWISFLAGLFAPLGAVCVLPLYPGFLAYLAGVSEKLQGEKKFDEIYNKKLIIGFSLLSILGIFTSMLLVGFIFTFLLKVSLTDIIGIVSPIAFGILGLVSLFLIFNFDFTKYFPQVHAPVKKNPSWSSFLFGNFFGLIVLPCNPASLIVLFAVSTNVMSFFTNLMNFVMFAIGMGLPLFILAVLSASSGKKVINFLTHKKRQINIVAGVIMLGISVYYLLFVFKIFG